VVPDRTISDFIGALNIRAVDAAAARFQIVADLTDNSFEQRTDHLDPEALRLLQQLARESNNKHYREIMRAIIAAIAQGPHAINGAHLTATQVVESAFRWTRDYFSALERYRERLRGIRQSAKK